MIPSHERLYTIIIIITSLIIIITSLLKASDKITYLMLQ